jgi:hypothetical protein
MHFHNYNKHQKNDEVFKKNTMIFYADRIIENKNVYPQYFKLNSKIKYIIDTKIKLNFDNKSIINDKLKFELYTYVFHLRLNMINEYNIIHNTNLQYNDCFDLDDKIYNIEYNLGESLFFNGYHGPVKKTINICDTNNVMENNDNYDNYDDDIDDKTFDNTDNESEEYLSDIMKINIKLNNKMLELENKINKMNIILTNTQNQTNYFQNYIDKINIDKINRDINKYKNFSIMHFTCFLFILFLLVL